MNSFPRFFSRLMKALASSGVREYHDTEGKRRVLFVNILSIVGVTCLVALGSVALYQGAQFLAYADFIGALFFLLVAVYLHYTGNQLVSSHVFALGANVFFCILFYTGGVKSTAFMWLYTYPTLAFFLLGLVRGTMASLFLYLFTACFLLYDLNVDTVNVYHADFTIRFLPSFLVVLFFSFLLEYTRTNARSAMLHKQNVLTRLIEKLVQKEKQLEEAQSRMEQRVAERTVDLLEANEQLVREIEERKKTEAERRRLEDELSSAQKMELLGRLAGGVAHDLNNVLTGIVGYPDLLLLDLPENSHLRNPLMSIKKSGEKAAAIVQDLLALTRRGVMEKKQVSLNPVVCEYLQSPEFSTLCANHPDIIVEQCLADNLQEIYGSVLHLQKAIMNLIVNAFEAVDGPGKVDISTENISLKSPHNGYEAIEPGEYVVLKISDCGSGMPVEVMQKIFEPFFTRKQMGRSGTGLGMTVVWGTMKDHDGYVDIVSDTGKGTTICLFFPVHDPAEIIIGNGSLEKSSVPHGKG